MKRLDREATTKNMPNTSQDGTFCCTAVGREPAASRSESTKACAETKTDLTASGALNAFREGNWRGCPFDCRACCARRISCDWRDSCVRDTASNACARISLAIITSSALL